MIFLTKKNSDKTVKKDESSDMIEICDAEGKDIILIDEKKQQYGKCGYFPV